jgi:hypothetical protein
LNEEYTGNKIKEIQIEENWMEKSCFNL